jgi:hypothetical protein
LLSYRIDPPSIPLTFIKKEFWIYKKGRSAARNTIIRRKNNTTTAMKKKFEGRET